MAENKKGFLLYADLLHTVEKMPHDKAGELFKHVLMYVNDLNPESEDLIVQLTFEPIKQQLKRDLKDWEDIKEMKSINGRIGNLKKYNPDLFIQFDSGLINLVDAENIAKHRKASHSDKMPRIAIKAVANVAVNVNDNVNVINNNRNENFKTDCLNSEQWKETFYMQKLLTPENFEFALRDYNIHLIQQGEENKYSLSDYKKHFTNWVKKRKKDKT